MEGIFTFKLLYIYIIFSFSSIIIYDIMGQVTCKYAVNLLKNKSLRMWSSDKKSAIKHHYLSSILPFNTMIIKQEQITKNRDFYKPEQLIWNNAHRTSQKIYPYYHKANDQYLAAIKPEIQRLEQQDRRNMQKIRIENVNKKRDRTLSVFYEKKRKRVDLQTKSGLRNRQYTVASRKIPTDAQIFKTLLPSCSNRDLPTQSQLQKNNTLGKVRTMTVPQQTFHRGVDRYDDNLAEVRRIISEQVAINREQIRQKFNKRKIENMNSCINNNLMKKSMKKKY